MLHDTIGGRNNGYGNFDEGRTLVHEVGHYLGLEHTFMPAGSCDLPNDYTHGDSDCRHARAVVSRLWNQ